VDASVADHLRAAVVGAARGAPAAHTDALFANALALAERDGIPAEIAEVVLAYGEQLVAAGRHAEAAALVGRAAPWAGQLPALKALQAKIEASE
jgi:thioredoxin-like negative regulator of GroEL